MPSVLSPVADTKPEHPVPTRANNLKGAFLMLMAMFVFSAVDTLAKLLTADFHPFQIVWTRQLGLLACVIILFAVKGRALFKTHHLNLQLIRGFIAICSAILFVMAIRYVPLSEAITVTFIAPFVVTVASALLLGERVGVYRWSAVFIGFVGTLIVLRPGFNSFHPALLLALVAAIFFAFRQIISRHIGSQDSTFTTIAYTACVGFVLLSVPLPFIFQWPQTTEQLMMMAAMAILAAGGEILVIRSLEIALAVTVAPLHYTILVWGSLYSYFVFGHIADFWVWFGAIIIIASGLFTVYREWVRSQKHKNIQ